MGIFKNRRDTGNIIVDLKQVKTPGVFGKRRMAVGVDPAQEGSDITVIQPVVNGSPALGQYQSVLNVHIQRLKDIKVIDKKIEYKKAALLDFKDFVMTYFNSDHNYPNNIAVMYFIWSMDCGDVDTAIPLGLKLIKQKQVLPHSFRSSLPVFLCDKLYDWAAEKLERGESARPYLDNVIAISLLDGWELYEPVGSKMLAMAAKHADLRGDDRQTINYGTLALVKNERAGVKKLVNKAQAQLAKQKAEEHAQDSEESEVQESESQKDEQEHSQQDNSITADAPYDDVGE